MTVTGMRTTANVEQKRRVVDMAERIAMLDPDIGPSLTVLKKLKQDTRKCFSPKLEWLEDSLLANATETREGVTDTATSEIPVLNVQIFRVGDLLHIPAVGENMLVMAIHADSLSVIRGYGSTQAAAEIARGAQVLNLGSAMPEGSGDRGAKSTLEKHNYNYTQIFKTPVKISNTQQASKLYGGKDLAYQRRKALQEHKRDLAMALYFGQRKEDTSGDDVRRTMGGLLSFLSQGNVVAFDPQTSPLSYDDFDSRVAYKAFLHGSQNKLLVAGPRLYKAINSWAVKELVTKVGSDQTYGLTVSRLITSYGDLHVIYDKLLSGPTYGGYGMVLDLDYIRYAYLDGRDTKLITNIQENDADSVADQYLTECSLECKCPEAHVWSWARIKINTSEGAAQGRPFAKGGISMSEPKRRFVVRCASYSLGQIEINNRLGYETADPAEIEALTRHQDFGCYVFELPGPEPDPEPGPEPEPDPGPNPEPDLDPARAGLADVLPGLLPVAPVNGGAPDEPAQMPEEPAPEQAATEPTPPKPRRTSKSTKPKAEQPAAPAAACDECGK